MGLTQPEFNSIDLQIIGKLNGSCVQCLHGSRSSGDGPAIDTKTVRYEAVAEQPAAHMSKRQNPDDLGGLSGNQIVADVAKALFKNCFPTREMEERCKRLSFHKVVPLRIAGVSQASH